MTPYLARRDRLITVAPVSRCARSAGKGRRRSGRKVMTVVSRWPSRKGVRPRTVVSTSGSLGISGSEEHTSELQSLMRISYAVFCLKKKKYNNTTIQEQE